MWLLLLIPLLVLAASCREAELQGAPAPPPMLSTQFQRGVNYAHVHSRGHGYGSEISSRELDSLAAIGVTHVAITPFGYQRGATADRLAGWDSVADVFIPRDGSMNDSDIVREVEAAHHRHIAVAIKPQIWSHDFGRGNEWHGTVRQASAEDHRTWWKSYRAFILHYARLASASNAEIFCLGTELVAMSKEYPDEWRGLIKEIRAFYQGTLTYAAHWDREPESIEFWRDLDAIGINAYFPLDVADTAGITALTNAWGPHALRLSRLSRISDRPIVFTEAGYRPARGAFREPWRYEGGEPDPSTQERAYEALFQALHDSAWFQGLYLWKAFTDPDLAMRYGEDVGFTFRRRPAEKVVRRWYRSDTEGR